MECNNTETESLDLEALLDIYLKEKWLRPQTEQTYQNVVRRWINEMHEKDIARISRSDVISWRNAILSRARPETWNKYRRHMRAIMNHAVELELIADNPFAMVPPARTGRKLKKTVSLQSIERTLRHLRTDPEFLPPSWFWSMVIRAIFYTGVRRRQIVALRWEDVDLEQGTWHVRAETSKTHREWMLPLPHAVREDLLELYRRTEARLGTPPSKCHQVFNVTLFHSRYKGPQMDEQQLSTAFNRLSRALGERISPHRLRHTMATLLACQRDLKTLQEMLGHTNISTTLSYIHPDMNRMRELMETLPRLAE